MIVSYFIRVWVCTVNKYNGTIKLAYNIVVKMLDIMLLVVCLLHIKTWFWLCLYQ